MGDAFDCLRVQSKPKAHRNFFFPQTAGHTDGAFEAVDRFQHLGLNFGLTSQWNGSRKRTEDSQSL